MAVQLYRSSPLPRIMQFVISGEESPNAKIPPSLGALALSIIILQLIIFGEESSGPFRRFDKLLSCLRLSSSLW